MIKLPNFLKRFFSGGREDADSSQTVQDLRAAFATRYHSFKLLLTANNKALEIMSDLEKALEGNQTFGMSFVRSNCTAVSVNVFRMVKNLDALNPEKYRALFDRFKYIQDLINSELVHKKLHLGDRLVIPLREIDRHMADQVGSKMANVAEIKNDIGLPVPGGFVISALGYQKFLEHNDLQAEIDRRIQTADVNDLNALYSLSSGIQQLVIRSSLPDDLTRAIHEAFGEVERESGKEVAVSLRSSALGEDAAGTSFAGQFRSVLNVSSDTLIEAYKEVVASKYGLSAITYRLNRGIPDEDVAMCVGCMVMVEAVSGGVMYSRNPLNIRDDSIFINSVWGLPKAVVDGSVDPDVFVVSRANSLELVRKHVKIKEQEFVCYPDEGVCRMNLTGDAKSTSQSITDEQALQLSAMAVRLEDYYGSPQDIEWAIATDGSINILQCRPLQQMDRKTDTAEPEPPIADATVLERGGITASPGVACGPVFVVKNDVDRLKFPDGAVLVTVQSLPRWAPLLGRAAAVVTELGGVAGHLANVAREFGVPALFGVSGATDKVRNGDMVTVDADGLTMYSGCVERLLEKQVKKKNLMEGSPIYDILQRATAHIIPLNLLDPDSPEFHPNKCSTLHDITRFCHEKSVHEMFNFGKEHHFSERSSKQLVCHVPMQWWIINLDDGYKTDEDGKFVHIDNIVSIPMIALWEGVVAVPWEGPPPVDTRGFMSIMIQATSNPALDPSMRSAYAARNYFMISKNFCSLSSRFGFHFSTVEALVGERPSENYISFSFKGGAADYPRRVRRAVFVGGILEEFGFRVQLKRDSVFARLEGRDQDYMKERLRILGYMIIHTRQLDMVMSNDASVRQYREKIVQDLHRTLNNTPAASEVSDSRTA
ncbi:MAG TPA: PEP/pyruvate-binding domain-containing protein [Desulfomonilaceae bacterium]|nr:PEP/pyruvate-binding domain-containing protein [Desulfomonilaceae bacterium]